MKNVLPDDKWLLYVRWFCRWAWFEYKKPFVHAERVITSFSIFFGRVYFPNMVSPRYIAVWFDSDCLSRDRWADEVSFPDRLCPTTFCPVLVLGRTAEECSSSHCGFGTPNSCRQIFIEEIDCHRAREIKQFSVFFILAGLLESSELPGQAFAFQFCLPCQCACEKFSSALRLLVKASSEPLYSDR